MQSSKVVRNVRIFRYDPVKGAKGRSKATS